MFLKVGEIIETRKNGVFKIIEIKIPIKPDEDGERIPILILIRPDEVPPLVCKEKFIPKTYTFNLYVFDTLVLTNYESIVTPDEDR